MCSIGEDDFGDDGGAHAMVPQKPEDAVNVTGGTCSKCGQVVNDMYKLCFRSAECRDCFLAYVRHKFRAALGSSKILPRGAKVLLVIDGSGESLALLDMLAYAQTQNTHKRLHCTVSVLYVDETAIRQDIQFEDVQKLQGKYELFQFYTIPLGAGVTTLKKLSELNDFVSNSKFSAQLAELRSLTSRQDYLKQYRKRLIGQVAHRLQCGFVFMPSISTTLAAELLTSVSLGRGGSTALDVSLLDDRLCDGVKLVRPLKDLNEAEVHLYLRAQMLSPLRNFPDYGMDMSDSASLQNLTRAFVANLQQNFSATVSTVFRTGDKIAPNRSTLESRLADMSLSSNETSTCSFCNSALDNANSTTLLAIEYSGVVSASGTTLDKCNDLEKKAMERLHAPADKRLRTLCHACRNIQADFANIDEHLL